MTKSANSVIYNKYLFYIYWTQEMRVLWNTLCTFIYFSTCSECFSRTTHIIFINFWKSFNLKSDGAGFFERFLSQNDSKWGFSSIFKNWLVEFFDFLCEVTATESLENDLWFFWVQNQCMELFWVYWMNLQWYKGLKLAQRIFFLFFFWWGTLYWGLWTKRGRERVFWAA